MVAVLIFAAVLMTMAFNHRDYNTQEVSKQIIDKQSPIENRVSGAEILFGSGSITKSVTVYYLIASDGTACEVDMTKYSLTKINDTVGCYNWVTK